MVTDNILNVKGSIAFDIKTVEIINKKAAQIDPRLFLFAYYQPKPLPVGCSARTCFYLSVLNMYGLLWDCGKMVKTRLFSPDNSVNPIIDLVKCDFMDMKLFYDTVYCIRTCLCHNNSTCYHYNKINRNTFDEYVKLNGNISDAFNESDENQWMKMCRDFLLQCDSFSKHIDQYLDIMISEKNSIKKERIVNYWIESIDCYYKTDEEMMINILADRYILQLKAGHHKNVAISKNDVKRWVAKAWKKRNASLATSSVSDCYKHFIKTCQPKITQVLSAKNCPKPAFPLDVLVKATYDSRSFSC